MQVGLKGGLWLGSRLLWAQRLPGGEVSLKNSVKRIDRRLRGAPPKEEAPAYILYMVYSKLCKPGPRVLLFAQDALPCTLFADVLFCSGFCMLRLTASCDSL